MKFKVLSIDAWASYDGTDDSVYSWDWNNWHNFGEYDEERDGPLTEENAFKFLSDYINSGYENEFEVEDDQYNLVLVRKSDRMPIFAIEYGNKY